MNGIHTALVTPFTPGGAVALYFTPAQGSWIVPSGGCAGISLPAALPTLLPGSPVVTADPSGAFVLGATAAPNDCGLLLGAVDAATCTPTSLVQL